MINSIIMRLPVLKTSLLAAVLLSGGALINDAAYAMSAKECHQQFALGKKEGTIKNQSFNAFKAENCKDKVAVKEDSKKAEVKNTEANKDSMNSKPSSKNNVANKDKVSSAVASDVVFPNAIDPKYAKEKEGAARMHTCLDQYKANKASNKNGNLKWIQKGGGYYSNCLKHLKENTNH